MARRVFSGWVYIVQDEELPHIWVAHCLDYNIVSQGSTPMEAYEMVREAMQYALSEDLKRGLDPEARRNECDAEDWQPLYGLFDNHRKIPVGSVDESAQQKTASRFAIPISVDVAAEAEHLAPEDLPQAVKAA